MKIIVSVILLLYGLVMLLMCYIAIFPKEEKSKNKVNFYVTKWGNTSVLWFGKPQYNGDEFESNQINIKIIAYKSDFKYFGLNFEDFADMKKGDIKEVFLNLEDFNYG